MDKLRRDLVTGVAETLRERVVNGHGGELIPGVRRLASSLGVSVPTIRRALRRLEEQGLLESGGSRRRWKVVANEAAQAAGPGEGLAGGGGKRLLCLAPESLAEGRTSNLETFATLLDLVGVRGWEVMHRVENFTGAKQPRRSWDEILRFARPDALVVWAGTPVVGAWASGHGIRCLFIGGHSGTPRIPVLRVNFGKMVRDAVDRLLATGHRRIVMPMMGRSPDLVRDCQEIAGGSGIRDGALTIAESPYAGPEVMDSLLQRQWRQAPADGLIFMDWREFIGAGRFLRQHELEIPRDLSVILLTRNPLMDWHSPPISCYEHPVQLIARAAVRWITGTYRGQALQGISDLPPQWVGRDSVRSRTTNATWC